MPHLPILVPPTQGTQSMPQVVAAQQSPNQPPALPPPAPVAVVQDVPAVQNNSTVGGFPGGIPWTETHLIADWESPIPFNWLDAYLMCQMVRNANVAGDWPAVNAAINSAMPGGGYLFRHLPVPGYQGMDVYRMPDGNLVIAIPGTEPGLLPWVKYGQGNMAVLSGSEKTTSGYQTVFGPIHDACVAYYPFIETILDTIAPKNLRAVLVGHSLGGAVASYAQRRYNRTHQKGFGKYGRAPLVYTFGAPAFATDASNFGSGDKAVRVMRVAAVGDPVPGMVQAAIGSPFKQWDWWASDQQFVVPYHIDSYFTFVRSSYSQLDALKDGGMGAAFDWRKVVGTFVYQHSLYNYSIQLHGLLSNQDKASSIYAGLAEADEILANFGEV